MIAVCFHRVFRTERGKGGRVVAFSTIGRLTDLLAEKSILLFCSSYHYQPLNIHNIFFFLQCCFLILLFSYPFVELLQLQILLIQRPI